MEGRKQFTCYRSYYEAISRLPNADRLKAYDLLMSYAFFGLAPDIEDLPALVAGIFILLQPTLDAGRRKAENRIGKMKAAEKTNGKQPQNKEEKKEEHKIKRKVESEAECKVECECESKCKDEKDSYISDTHTYTFARFWQAYPRKDGMDAAACVFQKLNVSVDVILQALEQQKKQPQWQMEGGRYIPTAAKWLERYPWAQLPGSEGLDPEMQAAVRRMMTTDRL